jgi:hypothetical protein
VARTSIGNLPPRVVCPACRALVSEEDGLLVAHNYGDQPDWMDDRLCKLSGKKRFRRTPRAVY